MQGFLNGFALLANGLLTILDHLLDWKVGAGLVLAVSLLWMARLEIDDTDMRGAKPYLPRG